MTSSPAVTAASDARRQRFRGYVARVIVGGTGVIAGLVGLEGCRAGRGECVGRIGGAVDQVAGLRRDLQANPAPPCLDAADQDLEDALSFMQTGLETARSAVRSHDRVSLVQGLLLTAAGLWRAGQAVVAARRSNC